MLAQGHQSHVDAKSIFFEYKVALLSWKDPMKYLWARFDLSHHDLVIDLASVAIP